MGSGRRMDVVAAAAYLEESQCELSNFQLGGRARLLPPSLISLQRIKAIQSIGEHLVGRDGRIAPEAAAFLSIAGAPKH